MGLWDTIATLGVSSLIKAPGSGYKQTIAADQADMAGTAKDLYQQYMPQITGTLSNMTNTPSNALTGEYNQAMGGIQQGYNTSLAATQQALRRSGIARGSIGGQQIAQQGLNLGNAYANARLQLLSGQEQQKVGAIAQLLAAIGGATGTNTAAYNMNADNSQQYVNSMAGVGKWIGSQDWTNMWNQINPPATGGTPQVASGTQYSGYPISPYDISPTTLAS